MARVFLSYGREDAAVAAPIAAALERAGHDVWWDQHIRGGAQYAKEIEQALRAAEAVVVLWSEVSVESPWVRDEAASGRDRGRLVPLSLDGTEAPLGFRQFQTIALPRRRLGKAQSHALIKAVEAAAGLSDAILARPHAQRQAPALPRWWILAVAALIAFTGVGLVVWRPWASNGETVLSVGPASRDAASQALARDLAIKLGALQTASATSLRLVDAAGAANADLSFEAAAVGPAGATLALKSVQDSALLWSREFEQPSGRRPDLLQQLAYTAARVTSCATEGRGASPRLSSEAFKTYLIACAELSEIQNDDPRPVLRLLEQVVSAAPRFASAWSLLLLAESDTVSLVFTRGEQASAAVAEHKAHIARAKQFLPGLPAIEIAEAQLVPPRDFSVRARRIERAAARAPGDAALQLYLANSLSATGRTAQAVATIARARQLDPLSPRVSSLYIAQLGYSGAFEEAKRELAKAERLWPGTASVDDARFRFHYRYGDPQIAKELFEQRTDFGGRAVRMLIEVRHDPAPAKIDAFLAFVKERLRTMENPSAGFGFATMAFAQFGRTEDFFATLLTYPRVDDIAIISEVFFRHEFRDIRRDPRFLRVAQRAGLLDYWRTSGKWPDYCFENDQPYDCKEEAAKLK
ncbi:toll/interleukin-1 receptor domain-containing protein [Sphingomonas lutea]|uniref:Toll/interleukin-1 receptor domain-containing protein n=1 Tax=Sphingomonas lutea TaxID=1045317 RepID=A0A7G9SFP2_9SPHN|nr:toll/interleukin-1 receptor domain-containing protein [Sphingomonas lutea]QNN66667.1 toll/interleukin-1 receptor domain-containing protein [Sphingomonas lutea]